MYRCRPQVHIADLLWVWLARPDLTLATACFTVSTPPARIAGLVLDRDRNAALNILARGKELIALGRQCVPSG